MNNEKNVAGEYRPDDPTSTELTPYNDNKQDRWYSPEAVEKREHIRKLLHELDTIETEFSDLGIIDAKTTESLDQLKETLRDLQDSFSDSIFKKLADKILRNTKTEQYSMDQDLRKIQRDLKSIRRTLAEKKETTDSSSILREATDRVREYKIALNAYHAAAKELSAVDSSPSHTPLTDKERKEIDKRFGLNEMVRSIEQERYKHAIAFIRENNWSTQSKINTPELQDLIKNKEVLIREDQKIEWKLIPNEVADELREFLIRYSPKEIHRLLQTHKFRKGGTKIKFEYRIEKASMIFINTQKGNI